MGIFKSKPKPQAPPKNKNAAISDRDRAVLELKRQRDRMRKYRSGLGTIIAKESQYARELLAKNDKQRAVFVLKKKRYQERMMEKADKQMMNVEQMLMEISSAVLDQELFVALKMGKECLDALQRECSIDDVQDLMDDVSEGVRMQEEISATLGKNLTGEEMELLEGEVDELMGLMLTEEETKKVTEAATTKTTKEKLKTENEVIDELAAMPVPSHSMEEKAVHTETKKEADLVIF